MLRDRTVEAAIAAVKALNFDSVKARIMDPHVGEGWTREYADSIERAYRNYLIMLIKYPEHAEDILLSKDVDEFWHTHILQTVKYTRDCETVFGQYLHHAPHIGELTAADIERREAQAEMTRGLYHLEFSDAPDYEAIWSGAIRADEAAARVIAENAAISGATQVRAEHAAISGATQIRAEHAAISGATQIRAEHAAISGATQIRAEHAAISGATRVLPVNAELSATAIQ
jgi:hypothetical protein